MNPHKMLPVVILLPAVFLYLGWVVVSSIRSGQAYFPRIGYYSRKASPASFWAMILLDVALAAAFAAGWFFLLIELIDSWR